MRGFAMVFLILCGLMIAPCAKTAPVFDLDLLSDEDLWESIAYGLGYDTYSDESEEESEEEWNNKTTTNIPVIKVILVNATQLAVPQPVVPQPVGPQPAVPQPVVPQPAVPQPVLPQPVPQPMPTGGMGR